MATKRRGTAKRGAGRKRAASRRTQGARKSRPARPGARAGARERRREEAARRVEREAAVAAAAGSGTGHDPELEEAAQPPPSARAWVGEAAGVPGYARLVVDQQGEGPDARRRGEAEAELGRRREEAEGDAARREPGATIPALMDIGLELALGTMRLARTLATAPLRIGLAFLRPREM